MILLSLSLPAYGITYEYDELGRLKSVAYDFGGTINYGYDPGGNPTSVSVPPTVYGTDPVDGAVYVPVDQNVYVTFSEDVQPGTNYAGIVMKTGGTVVGIAYSLSGSLLTIDPVDKLNSSTTYAVYIPAGAVKDLAGNSLTNEYILTFTTQSLLAVVYTDPADGATDIPVDKTVYVTFSGDVQPGPDYGGIAMKAGDTVVAVTYSISGPLLTIDPVGDLNYSTTYAVYIPAGAVKDLAGNALASDCTFAFATQASPDTTPPTVTITSPANNSTVGPSGELVTIAASATDKVGVTKVAFYIDNVLIGEDTVPEYTYDWQATVGKHTVVAKAYDAAGNVGTSSTVNIKVPAKVTVTSPQDGSTVGGIVTPFEALFSDPLKGTIYLYIDGVRRYSRYYSAPVTTVSLVYSWDTNEHPDGSSHLVEVWGYTETGSVKSVGKSTVTVDNS